MPLLDTLVLEFPALWEDARNIRSLLTRSQCTIRTLQVQAYSWEDRVYTLLGDTPSLLKHASITPSLTHLLITSQDLDTFFVALDIPTRNVFTSALRQLRSVDQCFRIDDLPGISQDENTGVLAALIRASFPVLEQLDLDCRKLSAEDLEARTVITGATSFLLRRPRVLRQEYESWWNSQDGAEFQIALSTKRYVNIVPFEVSWSVVHGRADPPHPGQNLFSNTQESRISVYRVAAQAAQQAGPNRDIQAGEQQSPTLHLLISGDTANAVSPTASQGSERGPITSPNPVQHPEMTDLPNSWNISALVAKNSVNIHLTYTHEIV
ncbi:hypothetical protein DFH09DRAFT_1080661 [Mycena vulgaris]|nr:hypothetical protein DFH09DRAFT_1080661 [Mycena vulgaris]